MSAVAAHFYHLMGALAAHTITALVCFFVLGAQLNIFLLISIFNA
jgi:hypothetical protein